MVRYLLSLGLVCGVLSCSFTPINRPIPLAVTFPQSGDWHIEAAQVTSVSVQTPPLAMTGAGASALRVLVQSSDEANHGNRAEIARYQVAQFGDEVWYGFDVFIPATDPDTFQWQILTQFYQLPDFQRGETFDFWAAHPPVTLVREPGKLVLMRNVGTETRTAEAAFTKDAPHRILLHCRWSDGSDGLVEVWLDEVPMSSDGQTKVSGPTLWNRAGAYWKLGLYRGAVGQSQAPSTNEVWLDNIRLDRTKAGAQ